MKKTKYLYLVTAILMSMILIVGLTGCGSSDNKSEKTITLKLSHPLPSGSLYGQAYSEFAKYVEEETKGQIKVQVLPAGSLVSDPQALDTALQGTVDFIHIMTPYAAPTIKEITAWEVPGAYSGNKFVELQKQTQPILDKVFQKYGLTCLGFTDSNVITFTANKKVGKCIETPEDLKGVTIRTAGVWGGKAIENWGGTPVTIPIGDLPNALQLGTIDVAFTGWLIVGPNKLYEMAPYVTVTSFQEPTGFLIMTKKTSNKLNADQKAAIDRAAARWMEFNHNLSLKLREDFINTVKSYPGCKLVVLTPEQNKVFIDQSTEKLLDETLAIAGPEGAEFVKIFRGLRD